MSDDSRKQPPAQDIRIRELLRQRTSTAAPASDFFAEVPWQPSPWPGIEIKPCHFDAERRRVTTLFRMAPGAIYPSHRHGDKEEIYVLEGDVVIDENTYTAGDYGFAGAGTVDHLVTSRNGCICLLISSQLDEFLNDTNF